MKTFSILKNVSSALWITFGLLVIFYLTLGNKLTLIFPWMVGTWMLLVLVILEELYYMIEEKVIKPSPKKEKARLEVKIKTVKKKDKRPMRLFPQGDIFRVERG